MKLMNWDSIHLKIDARMIRAPENIMVNNNKIPGNRIPLVKNILIQTLNFIHCHRKRLNPINEDKHQTHQNHPHLSASLSLCSLHQISPFYLFNLGFYWRDSFWNEKIMWWLCFADLKDWILSLFLILSRHCKCNAAKRQYCSRRGLEEVALLWLASFITAYV